MREILFRGKREDNGEWVEGDLLKYETGQTAILSGFSRYGFEATEIYLRNKVIPETVCQFTGLTDKNGRKIFEGDIVKGKVHEMNGYRVRKGVIEYHDVGFIMNLKPNSYYDQKNIPFNCEIIGNIYDNPELLEVKQDG